MRGSGLLLISVWKRVEKKTVPYITCGRDCHHTLICSTSSIPKCRALCLLRLER